MHNKTKKRRILLAAVLLTTAIVLLGAAYLPVHGEGDVYDAVIRLHVIANSDSESDQALKMQVRDAVLAVTTTALDGCEDRDAAAARLSTLLPTLTATAEEALRQAGNNDPVTVTLSKEDYPTRNYESFCFPSGEYLSVKVMIGESAGKNWWCVLFPRLCTDLATSKEEQFVAVGFTPEQYKIITESDTATYKIRFRLLEFFEELGG